VGVLRQCSIRLLAFAQQVQPEGRPTARRAGAAAWQLARPRRRCRPATLRRQPYCSPPEPSDLTPARPIWTPRRTDWPLRAPQLTLQRPVEAFTCRQWVRGVRNTRSKSALLRAAHGPRSPPSQLPRPPPPTPALRRLQLDVSASPPAASLDPRTQADGTVRAAASPGAASDNQSSDSTSSSGRRRSGGRSSSGASATASAAAAI